MEARLESWPANKPLPKLLYTVPFGSNPTGYTINEERRKDVIRLSRKYNFLILEDDPYFHLYFAKEGESKPLSYHALCVVKTRSVPMSLGGLEQELVR